MLAGLQGGDCLDYVHQGGKSRLGPGLCMRRKGAERDMHSFLPALAWICQAVPGPCHLNFRTTVEHTWNCKPDK